MEKSVLMSIKPEWCEKIASGKKTVEVRKNRPKLETPFKVYIYETKAINHNKVIVDLDGDLPTVFAKGRGKVIGEFVCDGITEFFPKRYPFSEDGTCLIPLQIMDYANGKKVYGWHITDLVIYDKPKELSEFLKPGYKSVECLLDEDTLCKYCRPTGYGDQRMFTTPNGPCFCEGAFCETAYEAYLEDEGFRLYRPPKSWCYVEELA